MSSAIATTGDGYMDYTDGDFTQLILSDTKDFSKKYIGFLEGESNEESSEHLSSHSSQKDDDLFDTRTEEEKLSEFMGKIKGYQRAPQVKEEHLELKNAPERMKFQVCI